MALKPPLIMIAGAKGAVGSTTAAAVATLAGAGSEVMPWLTFNHWLQGPDHIDMIRISGWDVSPLSIMESLSFHKVLPKRKYLAHEEFINNTPIRCAPSSDATLKEQVEIITRDMASFRAMYPENAPVLVNLLPAKRQMHCQEPEDINALYCLPDLASFHDLAYVLAAIRSGVPVVNFTSNTVEMHSIVHQALQAGVPMCGRDGKTGQTYLKVVLASAMKARSLRIDGWYSLNILGNEDGRNLSDPSRSAGKLANKTELLDAILGYQVGERYDAPAHKVTIDYYPPRGDSKEAWDVIDFTGIFDMPMSLRLNLQARDSILAAPMVVDLAFWMTALHESGLSGLVPGLGFYFKKPLGNASPMTFQEQVAGLQALANELGRTG